MSDSKDPHSDEHIEDLLSQLQGIFGKLSQSEEEESQQKEDPPPKAPPPAITIPPAAPIMEPSPPGAPPITTFTPSPVEETPPPIPVPAPEETPTPVPVMTQPPVEVTPPPVIPPPVESPSIPVVTPIEALPDMSTPLAPEPAPLVEEEEDGHNVRTIIYYPVGQDASAKTLSEKLQTMAPKFTKVAFQLRVANTYPYDLKGDARETLLSQPVAANIRAVFFIVERPLDDVRKKGITGLLEPRAIYFQEVPLFSIEKKAFYTDLLLGLVFFFDSLKSKNGSS